ncbi:hypothetical protein V2A60_002048 [Cordyceps javanica]
MQLSQLTLVLATAAVASANVNPLLGNRFTDHKCKVLHSKPNRAFHVNECIELQTVGSLTMNFAGDCYLYDGHQCHGKVVAQFETYNGDGKVGQDAMTGMCYDTSRGRWPKAKSFDCVWKD